MTDVLQIDPGTLSPNALLILLAIDARNATGNTASAKSDDIGWMLGTNPSWVHRHGAGLEAPAPGMRALATLSSNGHVFLSDEGRALALRLRCSERPAVEPPGACGCGCGQEGPCVGGRQLYACGVVKQWCPDRVPGLPKAEIAPRSRKAQHEGLWISVTHCSKLEFRRYGRRAPASKTSDGTPLVAGMPVNANQGSGAVHLYGSAEGVVEAAAAGIALVSWPSVGGRPGVEADILRASQLLLPGELDLTGLSDHQQVVLDAYRDGSATFARDDDGVLVGLVDGRRINPRTTAILAERGLVADEPWEVPAAPGMR